MSVGNPKKFEDLSKLKKALDQTEEIPRGGVSKVYMDKNYKVKKALRFKTDNNRSKLA